MGKCDIKISKNADKTIVQVVGTIDEDMDFTPHGLSGAKAIELDLAGIKSINSCGIREWIKWMGTSGSASIDFFNCPKVIVDQINMVDGFLPSTAKVQSFFVPYYNEDAGSEKNILFARGTHFNESGLMSLPEIKDEEGNVMEMDVIEAKYFKFLKK